MYKTERCLKVHSLVHASARPFVCSYCNKGFLSSTKLKVKPQQIETFLNYALILIFFSNTTIFILVNVRTDVNTANGRSQIIRIY